MSTNQCEDEMTQHSHVIDRTSPFGEPFVGKCRLCGVTGLRMGDALKPCPYGVTGDNAVLLALEPPEEP